MRDPSISDEWQDCLDGIFPENVTVVAYWHSYPATVQVGHFWHDKFYEWTGYSMDRWLDKTGEIAEEWRSQIKPHPIQPDYFYILPSLFKEVEIR